jgi:hypothetical protein
MGWNGWWRAAGWKGKDAGFNGWLEGRTCDSTGTPTGSGISLRKAEERAREILTAVNLLPTYGTVWGKSEKK